MGWDGMGWDGMGWDRLEKSLEFSMSDEFEVRLG
jgi:hypothetical protein